MSRRLPAAFAPVVSVFVSGLVAALLTAAAPVAADPWPAEPVRLAQATQAEDPMRERSVTATVRRYASLRSDEVNVRVGPGVRYPVKWVFRQKSIPVEIVQEYDTWRKIRDWEGAEGWVHRAMLSSRRSIIITGETLTLRRRSSDDSPAVARLARGVVAELQTCTRGWCEVEVGGYDGWLRREGIWGLRSNEVFP